MAANTASLNARRRWFGMGDDVVACFAASAGCSTVGACGWIANVISEECTNLHGLLVVGGFYAVCGVVGIFRPQSVNPAPVVAEAHAPEADSTLARVAERLSRAAANRKWQFPLDTAVRRSDDAWTRDGSRSIAKS